MKYAFIDLETTGLSPEENQILEVAVIKSSLDESPEETFHTNVYAEEVPEFITNLTGITTEDARKGEHIRDVLPRLSAFLEGVDYVVAQFAPFDLSFIKVLGIVPDNFICTRSMSKMLEPEISSSLRPTYSRLFGEELNDKHDALGDARAAMRIFLHQKAICDERGLEYENVVVDHPDRPLSYIPPNAIIVKMGE